MTTNDNRQKQLGLLVVDLPFLPEATTTNAFKNMKPSPDTPRTRLGSISSEDDDNDDDLAESPTNNVEMSLESPLPPPTAAPTMTWSQKWTNLTRRSHDPILWVLHLCSRISCQFPRRTVLAIAIFSIGILAIGIFNGIPIDTNDQFSPRNSAISDQSDYLSSGQAHFTGRYRYFSLLLHGGPESTNPTTTDHLMDNNNNTTTTTGKYRDILHSNFIDKAFTIIETIQNLPSYHDVCTQKRVQYINPLTNQTDCEIYSVTRHWNHNRTLYEQTNKSDIPRIISRGFFPDGQPAAKSYLYGRFTETNDTRILTRLEMANVIFFLPSGGMARRFEQSEALDAALSLRQKWKQDEIVLEVSAESSLTNEFERTITDDIPLVGVIFIVMSIFTAATLTRCHAVHSRALLGVGAVVTVLLSIAAGLGMMFLTKVPFSNLTQILPFIVFGVGLDDAFILIGAYERTDPTMPTIDRIHETIDEIGLSITLTSLTSAIAFGFGCLSSVYSVYWLCLYAVPLIVIVFFYTVSFFVALVVLDEERIKQNRRDCCVCISGRKTDYFEPQEHFADRIMGWYAQILLLPAVKVIVVLGFLGLFVNCAISATKFTEKFNFKDALPRDSYILDYANVFEGSSDTGRIEPNVYFRNVDFNDTIVRQQMRAYLKDLSESPYFEGMPELFWLDYFEWHASGLPKNMTFNDQIQNFLSYQIYRDLFASSLGIDENGEVVASRTRMRMVVDTEDAKDQVAALIAQEKISKDQLINQDRPDDLAFFCYDGIFKLWEFLRIAKQQLISTTIVSIVAVTLVALIFIPHWSAFCFVFPLSSILFIDLIGVMQWAGLHLNPVSYVSLTMSIGLVVDYVLHVLFRYYEVPGNRVEKSIALLRTMGASVLLGGTTTFIGIIPLMFSVSDVFETVFYTFLGIVVLGLGHGLILLPVLLSMFGPEETVSMSAKKKKNQKSVDFADGNYPDRFEKDGRAYAMETTC